MSVDECAISLAGIFVGGGRIGSGDDLAKIFPAQSIVF
jgi:hypothetical protein